MTDQETRRELALAIEAIPTDAWTSPYPDDPVPDPEYLADELLAELRRRGLTIAEREA